MYEEQYKEYEQYEQYKQSPQSLQSSQVLLAHLRVDFRAFFFTLIWVFLLGRGVYNL